MKCNNSTISLKKLLLLSIQCTLILISVLVLSGCFNTLVSSPLDIAKVSKLLSKQEKKIKATNTAVVNLESHQLYSIVESLLSKQGYIVRKYKYNSFIRQYHSNDLYFKIKSPDSSKGAVIASRIDYTNTKNRITMVYIEPVSGAKQTSKVKVSVSNDKFIKPAELLSSILNKTGTIEVAPTSDPTDNSAKDDSSENPAKDAADAALENLDKKLAE